MKTILALTVGISSVLFIAQFRRPAGWASGTGAVTMAAAKPVVLMAAADNPPIMAANPVPLIAAVDKSEPRGGMRADTTLAAPKQAVIVPAAPKRAVIVPGVSRQVVSRQVVTRPAALPSMGINIKVCKFLRQCKSHCRLTPAIPRPLSAAGAVGYGGVGYGAGGAAAGGYHAGGAEAGGARAGGAEAGGASRQWR